MDWTQLVVASSSGAYWGDTAGEHTVQKASGGVNRQREGTWMSYDWPLCVSAWTFLLNEDTKIHFHGQKWHPLGGNVQYWWRPSCYLRCLMYKYWLHSSQAENSAAFRHKPLRLCPELHWPSWRRQSKQSVKLSINKNKGPSTGSGHISTYKFCFVFSLVRVCNKQATLTRIHRSYTVVLTSWTDTVTDLTIIFQRRLERRD